MIAMLACYLPARRRPVSIHWWPCAMSKGSRDGTFDIRLAWFPGCQMSRVPCHVSNVPVPWSRSEAGGLPIYGFPFAAFSNSGKSMYVIQPDFGDSASAL